MPVNETDSDSYDLDLINYHDLTYYGTLWFFNNDPPQQLKVVFDTGSSWVWAGVEGCDGCPQSNLLNQDQLYECSIGKTLKSLLISLKKMKLLI